MFRSAFKTARKLLVYLIVLSLVFTAIPFEVYGIEYQATNLVLDYGKIDGAGTRISAAGGSISFAVGDFFYIALDSSQINDNIKIMMSRMVSAGNTKYEGVKSASLISDTGNSVYDGLFYPSFASYQSSNFLASYSAEFQLADIADIKSIDGMVYLLFSSDAATTFFSAQAFTNVAAVTTYTISGNAGIAGATLSYTDGTAKTATADSSGNYSFTVSSGWTGTVTPSKLNYLFTPASMSYSNVTTNQSSQNYSAAAAYTYDFEANTSGNGTNTVTQSVNGEAVSCTVTGDFWQIFTENDSIGADLETFSGNTLMTDTSYEDSGATSIRINTVGNKLFTLKSLNLFDNYYLLHSWSNITLTSSKGGTPVELTDFTSYSSDSGYMSIDLSANPNFKDVTYVDFTVSSGKMLLVLDNIVLSDIKEGEVWNEISNRTQLENIKNNLSGNYRLMADIDLAGQAWNPLGSSASPFTGKFDGNSKIIRNLTITDTTKTDQGLFSTIGSSGSVSKLGIEGANITAANNTGVLAGTNAGTISQCYTKGSVGGFSYVGGLVGQNSGTIQNSYTQASVSGKDFYGGLAGSNSGMVLTSYASSPLGASVFNNYLSFNGTPVGNYSAPNSGGYINIAHKDYYVQNKFTLEAWFQWDNVGTDNCNFIIGKGYEQFEIHTGGGAGVNGLRFIPIWNTGGDSWIDVKNVIQPGWFHVAAVYDYSDSLQQATCRVFINGVAQDLWRSTTNLGKTATINRATNTLGYGMVSGSLVPQQNNINIGRRTDGWFYFDGKISDVRFWNIARTETEIKRDKDKVLTGTEAGLVGYWKLNEASGNALDSTPNGNNGTLVGDVVRTSEQAAVHKGGLIGYNTGTVNSSFYDSEVANLTDDAAGIHKSTAEMRNGDTFTGAGWNFTDLWDINSAYPYFKNQTFSVYFESNGGGAVNPIYGKNFLETITQPGNPSKTDYIFGGWYKEPSLTNPWDFASDTMPARDITLYARWLGNQCTVTYDAEGGSVTPASQIKMVGATYGKGNDGVTEDFMPIPTKEGYTFNGWYSGDNGTGNYIPNSTVVTMTANHTLYAKWSLQQYTLTFDTEGGNAIAPITQNYSTQVAAPTDPTKEGHTFAGWYEGDNGTGSEVSFPFTLTSNKTVYAKWNINPYTVTFKDYNDATLKTETVLYGAGATAPANPARTGYTFTGWSAPYTNITGNLTVTAQYAANTNTAYKVEHYLQNVNGVGYTLADTDSLTGTTDTTATAVAKSYTGFVENTGYSGRIVSGTIAGNGSLVLKLYYDWIPYTVTFKDYNDAILKTETVLYGANATAPAEPTRAGYTFAGWSTAYTNITGNLTVTAQYTANTNTAYKVEHYQQKVNGTGYTLADTDDQTGTTDLIVAAVPKDYTGFVENTSQVGRVPWGTIAGNGSLVLKLYYDRIPYTVTFKDYNNTVIDTQTVLYGADAAAPADPTRAGYTFTGWSAAITGITGNLTVTAQYAANTNTAYKVEHYKQNVNGAGYTLADTDNLTGTTDQTATAVAGTYIGFAENTGYPGRVATGTIAGNGSLVLKLYYDRIPYTITFKDYNDTTLKTETVVYGADATAPADPTRTGYTFKGWSTAFTSIAGDLAVTAQYTANTSTAYKVEHYKQNVNGAGYTLADTDNLTGTTDQTATAAAKTYTGFSENSTYTGRVATGTIAGNGSLVLKLYYDRIPYTVVFKDHDNAVIDTQTVLYGADATAPADPIQAGYTFTGWSATYTNIIGNLAVTAQYTANTNTAYKVEHYKQNVDGTGYTLADTDNLTGTTDQTATAAAKTYTGFSENSTYTGRVATGTIAGNGSLVLKLYYDRIPYTVTFKDYDNAVIDTQTVLYGANATTPADPTRAGYTFTGWSAAYTNIIGNLAVTAQYIANTNTAYKVEHYQQNVNGAGYTLADTDNLTGTTDQSATALTKTYTGFAENTSHVGRVPSGTIAGNGSLVLKLYYDRIPYTVTFKDYDNAVIDTQTVLYGADATAPADPTRAGYTFTSWSVAFMAITGNLAVTAQYAANTNTAYKVEHYQQNVNGAGYTLADTDNLAGTTDQSVTALAKSYTGFAENTSYAGRIAAGIIAGNGSLVLKLYYNRIPYTVTFKDHDNAVIDTQTVLYGADATAPADPTRTGYTFKGWSAAFTVITGNLAVTAQYTANTNTDYKVEHYQQNVNGTGYTLEDTDNLTGTTDQSATALTKTYIGFAENTSHVGRVPSGTIAGNGSLVLKLYYDRIPYTVTFKDYDNAVIDTQTVLYGADATAPADPTRAGYTFTGWSAAFAAITGNLAVTAQYEANTNTAYRVEHYQQNVNGAGYTLVDTDDQTGTTDQTAIAAPKSYTGFSENISHPDRVASGVIAGDGSRVLKLYYDRAALDAVENQVLQTRTVGYATGVQEIKSITLTRKGSGTVTGLSVTISGGKDSNFEISQPVISTLNAEHPSTTFTVKAKDNLEVGSYTETVKISGANVAEMTFTVTQVIAPVPAKKSEPVIVIVNGVEHEAASVETKKVKDQTITTVTVDDKKIEEKLQNEGAGTTVIIPVNNKADVVVGELNGQTVKNMEIKDAVLEIKTENVTYTLPAAQINIDDVSTQIGKEINLADIKVSVTVATPPQDTIKVVENTANKNNYQVVVKPVEFTITCFGGEKTVDVSKFNGYVERMVAIPEGIDPSKITTGIVLNKDGTFSHVPTTIAIIDGKYYAKINSLTNSTYSIIWSPKTFEDVENHWAKEAINDMGSRLVIEGVGENKFKPDRDVTRAEFAVIVVKALGLMRQGTGKDTFNDVVKGSFYYDAVSIAYDYGIVSGFGNGEYRPMEKITREEAMSMAAKALKLAGLKVEFKPGEMNGVLTGFGDSVQADNWAKASMAECIKTGIVSGKSGNMLAPKELITRAEVAAMVRNLLQKSGLI